MAGARLRRRVFVSALAAWLCAGGLFAQETTTYSYDPLGRLTGSTISGGPDNGVKTTTCFDSAGNRTQYQTGSAGQQACSAPTPTSEPSPPTPPPAPPAPPVAAQYTGQGNCIALKTINVVQNDTDPGGYYPITVVSVGSTWNVEATVYNSTSVRLSGSVPGTDTIPYTIADSRGALSSGVIIYTTTSSPSCYY